MKKILLSFTTVALAVASAASSYRVTLFQPAILNGTELKPGDYKVTIKDNKAVLKSGKTSVEAKVTQETYDALYELADSGGWVIGEMLERAAKALKKEIADSAT